ncbi:hypothetical protein COOONC_04478, partial [Cooperia oncophora]
HVAEKAAERFEAQTIELSNKVEDLNRHEVHDQKVQLDNLQHVKYTLAQQLEEARRRLEDAERERSQLQSQLHQVQLELDSVRQALDEESVARSDAEHKLNLANTEITQWKSKFDAEVALHHEEVEDLRKKMLQKQAEYEEQIEIMLQKISQLEKAKSRLQSEVEVLIVDLEKAQNTIAILERAKEQLEKQCAELKVRIDELTVELEAVQRELRAANAELQKMKHLYEKAVEQKEALARENKKLHDELHEAKEALADANRKLHELDLENARLAGEIRELQTALKEADAQRRDAENRAQRALAELQALRIEMERRLQEKEEEMEALRKNMQFEIDRLTAALADAEARMKAEISRLKKKYQAEIAELEMTVDNLNRANIEAQKTIKKQSEQLKILQASLEDTQRQLQQVLDQYALAQRKVAALSAELEEAKTALDNAIRARKQAEIDLEEANGRIADLSAINNNLTSIKNKLETELSTAQADLDEETQNALRKKDRRIKEVQQLVDEEHKNFVMAQDTADRLQEKLNIQKRQLAEAESVTMANLQRVRRYQHELEDAEGRADQAESSLHLIRAKHRSSVVTGKAGASKVTKELHAADERANRALADAARAVEQLHEEQEHSMKIDALRKSLEEQVKQLQVQIQEAEAAALLGGKRVIAKLETRIRDLETALDEETRRHKETQNALRKKDRRIKEVQQLVDEEHKNFVMAQDTADRLQEKLNIQKRQLAEAESVTMANLQRVRRYQHELEDAEGRADQAESSLHLIRAKHRSSVVTGKAGASKVYVMEDDF